jgi:hypothetical protein
MDSTTDNSFRTLWRFTKLAGVPDFLKEAALVDAKDAASLPDSAFADVVHRRFPLTDRANTWASAGYFAKTAGDYGYSQGEYNNVHARINRAAALYGIDKEVSDLMSKVAEADKPVVKQAADDKANYCDPDNMGYPVFDKTGAEMANEFFTKHAYKYGHERRMAIAKNVMRKCAEYGVTPTEQVRLSSGGGFPNREALAEDMFFRARALLDRGINKMAAELCKFAKEICVCSDEDLDQNRESIFHALAGIDEMSRIDDLYGQRFHAPEEVVFDITPEAVKNVIDDAVPMGRETFSAKALSELPRKLFDMVLPKDSVDGMMEDGKISPKKLSVTIIGLKSPETSNLLKTIKGFTDGTIDVEEDCDPEECTKEERVVAAKEQKEDGEDGKDSEDGGSRED